MNRNMYLIKTTAIVLASSVVAGNTMSAYALAANTEKDENVYVDLNQDGSVGLMLGATEIGQGADTVFSQMTA